MQDWADIAQNVGIAALLILAGVYCFNIWVKSVASKRGPAPCSHVMEQPMKTLNDTLTKEAEARRKQIEKDAEIRQKQSEKQLEALNGVVMALTTMSATNNEMLRRVCDIERVIK